VATLIPVEYDPPRVVSTEESTRAKPVGELLFARLYLRHLSRPFTWLLLRAGATPNQVTVSFLLVGFAAAAMQLEQERRAVAIAGAFAFQLALVLDCVDGEIARARRLFSIKGPYLDMVGHRLMHGILFFCLGVGMWRRTGDGRWMMLGAGAAFGELAYTLILYAKWRALLDHPDVLRRELDRIAGAAGADQKQLKAGFAAPRRVNPLLWPYHAVFTVDYPGTLLASLAALAVLDRADVFLWVYGTVLPARALLTFARRMFGRFEPEAAS
jgi:hypothetical protein